LIHRLLGLARGDTGSRLTPWALAALRIFAGALWLANLSWKLPPDFGRDDPEGLLYNFRRAEQDAVFGFLQTFMRDTVIPNFTTWAALVFAVEALAGVLLVLGLATRLGALVGLAQSVIITLLVVQAPGEWFWTYAMLIAIQAVLLVTPSAERLSVDRLLARRR
jgi:uncharacterized membrane protein YphA (DoxX/SURF4 family)